MGSSSEESVVNWICSSLRQRPAWASSVTQLLQSEGGRWREVDLVTHDIALGVPGSHSGTGEAFFHLLLLTPEDLANPRTLTRIQHLHSLTTGHNTALFFLLHTQDGETTAPQPAMQSFMDLHIKLQTHALPLPIIPLTPSTSSDPAALPTALRAFHSSLLAARAAGRWPVDAARELLPWCTTTPVAALAPVGMGSGTGIGMGMGMSMGMGMATSATVGYGERQGQRRWQGGSQGHGHGYGYGRSQGHGHDQGRGVDGISGALSGGVVEGLMGRWCSFGELLEGIAAGEVVGGAEGDGVVSFWQFEFATG